VSKREAWVSFLWFRIWAQLLYKILEYQVAVQKWRRGRYVYTPGHKAVAEPKPQKAPKPQKPPKPKAQKVLKPVRRRDGVGRHRYPEPVVIGPFSGSLERRLVRTLAKRPNAMSRAA
jgi:hypothetical protein